MHSWRGFRWDPPDCPSPRQLYLDYQLAQPAYRGTRYGVAYLLALGTTGGCESFCSTLCSLCLGLCLTLGLSASGSLYLQALLMLLSL